MHIIAGQSLAERLTLRFDLVDRQALARRSKAMGVGLSIQARMRPKDRLRQEAEVELGSR